VEERELIIPRWFDVIVGNPPYTRQEEIPDIGVDKEKLIESALKDPSGKKIADISKRAGIHAYFFVHGTKFLKDSGHFGFIVSNSWLDADYGKGLQEFFLKNYNVITIIGSKVERWFEEADINTCIIILQKCRDKKERDENLIRFVYLKKPLRSFIPPAQDMWEKQVERLNAIDKLKKTILAHNDFYENEDLRIFPKSQKELWDEGFDPEEKEYVGTKWGKYLIAPEIFFKILNKYRDNFQLIRTFNKVFYGYAPRPVKIYRLRPEHIKQSHFDASFFVEAFSSPTEFNKILIDKNTSPRYSLLLPPKKSDKLKNEPLKKYIQKHKIKPLREMNSPALIWPRTPYSKHVVYLNTRGVHIIDHIGVNSNIKQRSACALLNSTLFALFQEIYSRTNLGLGPLKIEAMDIKNMPAPKSVLIKKYFGKIDKIFNKISCRAIGSHFEELGSLDPEHIAFDKVKPDRRELDKIIMGDVLGLTDEEQLEVYRAVVDLVKSRIEKAKSTGKNKKIVEGIDITALKNTVIERIKKESPK
jgi:hypothetical protein